MFEDKTYELWNGDCLELMKNIPDKSVGSSYYCWNFLPKQIIMEELNTK